MAETDADRRAAGALSEEEADRLSERFRASWEEDPPTVPRDQPIPTAPTEPRSRPAPSGPAVTTAPVVNITKAPVVPVTAEQTAPATAARAAAPLTVTPSKKATIVGTAPPAVSAAQAPASADEWEISTSPQPGVEAPMPIEVEELPPESKPSGIGQKYKPKDEGAPAVVLGDDVRQAETGTRVQLEAEHRARRAPTIVRMNAFDLPKAAQPAPEPEFALPRKRSFGMVVALGLCVLGGGALVALLVTRGNSAPSAETATATATMSAASTVAPDTAAPAPPPPALTAEPPAAAATPSAAESAAMTAPVPLPVPVVTPAPSPVVPAEEPKAAAKPTKAALIAARAAAPVAKPVAQKAAAARSAPATSKPAPAPKSGMKNTIVRETPF